MDKKKIFAIAIVVFAVFCCLSVASAGLFDFLGGGSTPVNNKTVSFENIFSLQLPEDSNITNKTTINDGDLLEKTYNIHSNSTNLTCRVTTCTGPQLISSAQGYADNLIARNGVSLGNHSNWLIINTTRVPIAMTPMDYVLTMHDGSYLLTIEGNNLTQLEHIADTYKK